MSIEIRVTIILGNMSGQGGFFFAYNNDDFEIYGSEFSDTLSGLSGDDTIFGLEGNDKLFGQDGDDRLFGGAGNDLLSGGAGADTLKGGSGADTYVINASGDIIDEGASLGLGDRALTNRSIDLAGMFGGDVEHARLLGEADLQVAGNGWGNVLLGNSGDNRLAGRLGSDKLNGLGGDDVLVGGAGADVLRGGGGRDSLVGGPGEDTMHGGSGADRFIINTLGSGDVIADFDASDVLVLTQIDADTSELGNQAFRFINGAFFTGRAGELRFDGSEVQGDVNGDGKADFSVKMILSDLFIFGAGDIAL